MFQGVTIRLAELFPELYLNYSGTPCPDQITRDHGRRSNCFFKVFSLTEPRVHGLEWLMRFSFPCRPMKIREPELYLSRCLIRIYFGTVVLQNESILNHSFPEGFWCSVGG